MGKKHQKKQRTFIGKIQKNPRGFAFVLSQEKNGRDVYVPREEAASLMTGDTVEYSVLRSGQRTQASIHKIVERGQKKVIGQLERLGRQFYLRTLEGDEHVVTNPSPEKVGQWTLAEIEHYPGPHRPGEVQVTEYLGPELLPQHDILLAACRFGLPLRFSTAVKKEAESARALLEETSSRRRDLRHLPFVTIDGEDAKDFDDAIYVERPKGGGTAFKLYVAIADVSHFVRPGTHLDLSARKRGTSVYFPGFVIPMLPEELSNDLCSLRPREEKLTLTAEIHLDREGHVEDAFFYETLIQTARRLTYTEVHNYFHKDESTRRELESLREPLEAALALYRKLDKARKARGVLDFDLPEARVTVDPQGKPTAVAPAPRFESHKLIEEFMVLANQQVARHLKEHEQLALYRVHEAPDPSTLEDLGYLLRTHGLQVALDEISPKLFAKILAQTAEHKGRHTIHKAILRLQKQARYEPDPKGHFGLALADYAHFTSPIRRYPDLVVHRALKSLIYKERRADTEDEGESHFIELGAQTSESERRAMEAERFVSKRKYCWFMSDRVGETYSGVISGVESRGVFVEMAPFCIEGFVPLDYLHDDYRFDEKRQCLRRTRGHTTLSLGDSITVRVEQVSVPNSEITLAEASS